MISGGCTATQRLRLALEVPDADMATRRLGDAGAEVIAEPTVTPWRSRNARLHAPADLQLTLFEEREPTYGSGSGSEPTSPD